MVGGYQFTPSKVGLWIWGCERLIPSFPSSMDEFSWQDKPSGLYYKHIVTIISDHCQWCLYYKSGITSALALDIVVNYAPRATLKIVASLTDNSRSIYNRNIFIVQTTGPIFLTLENLHDYLSYKSKKISCLNRRMPSILGKNS